MRAFTRLTLVLSLLIPTLASAHVEVASGSAAANTSQKITFAIAHGCTDANMNKLDTISVRIDIPAGVTGVRALPSALPHVAVSTDVAGAVTAITFSKPATDLATVDAQWYELTIRAKTPATAFTQVQFNVTQVCEDALGNQTTVVWDQPAGSTTGNPAPQVKIVPVHRAGWNKVTLAAAMTMADVAAYFGDAQIVWKGSSAYSPNADVSAMITATTGVTAITTGLSSGDEVWVKY